MQEAPDYRESVILKFIYSKLFSQLSSNKALEITFHAVNKMDENYYC